MEGPSRHSAYKAASSEWPKPWAHMLSLSLSVGPTAHPEECDDMNEEVRASSHTEEAPNMEEHPPFQSMKSMTHYCQQAIRVEFWH